MKKVKNYSADIRAYGKNGKTCAVRHESWSANSFNKKRELKRIAEFIKEGVYDIHKNDNFCKYAKKYGVVIQINECKEVTLFEGNI